MTHLLVLVLAVAAAACGGTSAEGLTPLSPSPAMPSPSPSPGTNTVTVTLTATNGGQPLAGVTATFAGTTATTDASGRLVVEVPATTSASPIEFNGGTIVPRRLALSTNTRSVALDAIRMDGRFSLDFYRQLVRNGYEGPNNLQPLRRWNQNPRFYIRTVFGSDDRQVDESTLDTVADTIANAVAEWTGGRFNAAQIERGTETRENVPGWITVAWEDLGAGLCGRAFVGSNPGYIELHPRHAGCRCAGDPAQVSRWVVRHEVGHALGLWHTDSRGDVMYDTFNSCVGAISARERLHAPIAFARPSGNTDPDTDPMSTVSLAPSAVMVR